MGKRVEIRVDNSLHKELHRLKTKCSFKSVNQLVKHIVQLYVGLATEPHHVAPVNEDIQQMFDEFASKEAHGYTKPIFRHPRTIYDGEK